MDKFESSIKQIPHPQTDVYAALSDFSNLERVRDRMPEDKVKDMTFDADSLSVSVNPVGKISMRIVEREEPKTIKMESVDAPLNFNFWIQLLPVTEESCKMRLTIKADIPFFVKKMVEKPLQEGIEKIADTLAAIPYPKTNE